MRKEESDTDISELPLNEPELQIVPTTETETDVDKDRQAIVEILNGGNDVQLPWVWSNKKERGQA